MDYVGPDIEPEEVRETMRLKHMALFRFFFRQKNIFNDEEHKKPNQSIDTVTLDEKSITSPTEEGLPTLKKFGDYGSVDQWAYCQQGQAIGLHSRQEAWCVDLCS
jgi:hypothetical protein